MPISIRHGGGLPGLAGLLGGQGRYATRESQLRGQDLARIYGEQFTDARQRAQLQAQAGIAAASNQAARSRQAAALSVQSANSKRQISAQAQRQSQAADQALKRVAVQSGLSQEFAEQAYDREIQKMEEQARQRASERKVIYTEKGKQQIAQGNALFDIINNPELAIDYSQLELQQMERRAKALVETKGVYVPDTTPKPPKGFEPYGSGTLPNGMGYIVGPDGKLITQPFEHTKEGFAAVQQQEQREKQETRSMARAKEANSYYQTLRGRKVRTGEVVNDKPVEEFISPMMATAEVRSLYPDVNFRPPQPSREEQATQQAAQQAAVQKEQVATIQARQEALIKGLESKGYTVLDSHKKMSPPAMVAATMMAKILKDYGVADPRRLPQSAKERYDKAQAVVSEYQGLSDR